MKDFRDTTGASVPEESSDQKKDLQIPMGSLVGLNFTVWSNEIRSTKFGDRAMMWVSPRSKDFLRYSPEGVPYYERAICWGSYRIISQLATMKEDEYPFVATMVPYRDTSYQLAAALPEGETLDDIVPF